MMMSFKINRGVLSLILASLAWLLIGFITGSLCWFQAVLGFPCPACGTIRAAYELLRGNIGVSFAYHPLLFAALALLLYFGVYFAVYRKLHANKIEKIALLFIGLLYIVLFAVRMYLYFPHTEPLVPNENALWRQAVRIVSRIVV